MGFAEIREFCVYVLQRGYRGSWHILGGLLPMKRNRVVFDSFHGSQFSCNPRAIYEQLLKQYGEKMEFVWLFKEPEKFAYLEKNLNTKVCKYRSLAHHYYGFTSGTVIFNFSQKTEVPRRQGQLRIQTWHGGGCYKIVAAGIGYANQMHKWVLKKKAEDFTHFISSSQYFTEEVVRKQFLYHGKVLQWGMPRNAVFFHPEEMEKKAREVRERWKLPEDAFVVLYAPTYRDMKTGKQYEELDCERLRKAVEEKYHKKARILYRGHHKTETAFWKQFDLDVSEHPDMQDLLCAADLLITDYSSSIWDYSFKGSPCILFVPDLEDYQEYRGFNKDIHSWGYPVCQSNQEMENCIAAYDLNAYRENMEKHHQDLGSFESGRSAAKMVRLIMTHHKLIPRRERT